MTEAVNREIRLAKRPRGAPAESDFQFDEQPLPAPKEGEVLLRSLYLSLDPYMRGRISGVKSYADPVAVGDIVPGGAVGEVIESRHEKFEAGDYALGMGGWQDHFCLPGKQLLKLDPALAPLSTALGVMGMPGLTAYSALKLFAAPAAGETFFVSSASGAVGGIAGQIAKIMGGRVIGSAGGGEKCAYVMDELGFDACIDYKNEDLDAALGKACPDGIDINFENVGGDIFAAVFRHMNIGGRILLCGYISQYNRTEPEGPALWAFLPQLIAKRVTIRGHLVLDHYDMFGDFQRDMAGWIADGRIKYREDIVDGFDNMVSAFQGLLEGRNFGKLLVRVADDPTR